MLRGVFVAVVVTFAWISCQIAIMHIRPASNRFKAMLSGYLASLPLVVILVFLLPALEATGDTRAQALFNALALHLLLFLFYVEMFYHVERSVTLRILVELLESGEEVDLKSLQDAYSLDDMIERRLEDMARNKFIDETNGRWRNRFKGNLAADVMSISSWVFRSKSQKDRN